MLTNDFKRYFNDMKEECERSYKWLTMAAFLLGSRFVLESLKPKGSYTHPFLSKPFKVKDIPDNVFRDMNDLRINNG